MLACDRSQVLNRVRHSALFAFLGGLGLALVSHDASAGPLCFGASLDEYTVGSQPLCVAIGDLNNDGAPDLAVANHAIPFDNRVSILLNNGDGTMAPAMFYDTGDLPYWIALGDMDGDLDVDLAVSNTLGNSVSVLLNNGDGTFAAQVPYAIGVGGGSIVLDQLNPDAFPDLAVTNINDGTVSVLLNNGDGTFARQMVYAVGLGPYGIASGDFDGNGTVDLAAANYGYASGIYDVSILFNNGDGTFAAQVTYPVTLGPVGIAAADLNGDARPDLVVANDDNSSVSVLINNGDGTFAPQVEYAVGTAPYSIRIADFNVDGRGDLITGNETGSISILMNNGDGSFATASTFEVPAACFGVDAGDLDGNGTLEVVATDYGGDKTLVLFNQGVGITQQPVDVTVALGQPASFTVAAAGPEPFSYQWRRDGIDLVDDGIISGAATATLTIDPVSGADVGSYDVIVTNDCGPLTSSAAALTIAKSSPCPADFNGDLIVNGFDLALLLGEWTGAATYDPCRPALAADLSGDCRVNGFDLALLLGAWGACR